jgi:prefoldin subunit 5
MPPYSTWEEAPRSETLTDLKSQAEQLKQQMAAIEEKISKLNKGQ